MNKKIGAVSSIINLFAVLGFAVSMLFDFKFGSYLCSMFIALLRSITGVGPEMGGKIISAPFRQRLQFLHFSFSAFWVQGKENIRKRSWTK